MAPCPECIIAFGFEQLCLFVYFVNVFCTSGMYFTNANSLAYCGNLGLLKANFGPFCNGKKHMFLDILRQGDVPCLFGKGVGHSHLPLKAAGLRQPEGSPRSPGTEERNPPKSSKENCNAAKHPALCTVQTQRGGRGWFLHRGEWTCGCVQSVEKNGEHLHEMNMVFGSQSPGSVETVQGLTPTWETFCRSTNEKWLEASIGRGTAGAHPRQVFLRVTGPQDMFPSQNFLWKFVHFFEKDYWLFWRKKFLDWSKFKPCSRTSPCFIVTCFHGSSHK